MLSKKKKIFVLVGLVALLVLTGCLNIFLNQKSALANTDGDSNKGNFFSTYRTDRQTTRDQTMLYLDAIISNASSTQEAIANAEKSKLELTKSMEQELVLEGLIKALGFEDVVVTNTTENVNIIIKSPELLKEEVAQVVSIITTETGKKPNNIRIIPVE